MLFAVIALEARAGRADKAVALRVGPGVPVAVAPQVRADIRPRASTIIVIGVGVAAERGGGDGARGANRAAYNSGSDISRPEAGTVALAAVAVPTRVVPAIIVPAIT